jgi:hypothetical protein
MRAALYRRNVLLLAGALVCTRALAQVTVPHASTLIVRSLRSEGTQKVPPNTIRVRWALEPFPGSKQPDRVIVTAYAASRNGDYVAPSDTAFQERKLASPGVHDFTFAQLDRDHPQLISVTAEGYYYTEVFVDSGDIEVEVTLRHKF